MARPRSISDERLLAAAAAVIGRSGPGFTLAQVAAEAGVAVGTVAKRFGSKNGLLRALSRITTQWTVEVVRVAAAAVDGPLAALRAGVVATYSGLTPAEGAGNGAEAATNHLGQLGVDLGDPELRALLGEHYAALESELRRLVRRAAAVEDWRGPAPARAARVLLSVVNGAALDWSIRPKGRLADRLVVETDAVLAGWHREQEGKR
ncbi:TetR family transcriptional regulator [Amycolatopsis antarctica]|uniref:TetR family transcriptional regulator n=1 Tax=Amycolatopsis antarctica TaxID=1854586 RepID=A0A263D2R4_9PSEU|nr:TetR/AcrR family transcriptional regulator [Amycolatopsis antarctica]OZM72753.1 TetR family transcriptional regulator [Amycolatopsis antarctica]